MKKRQLLVETRPAVFTILDEEAGKPVRIRCEHMSVADEINGNGRVYPFDTWSREIGKLQEKLAGNRLVGSADHPADGKSRITGEAAAAIKWEKLFMDGKTTVGEGVIVPTQAGKDLEALIRAGVVVDVSSRGFGSALERMVEGKRALVVQEDFELLTFDAVLGGSVSNAHLKAVAESQTQGGDTMDWKAQLEALRKEHPEVFENYEKSVRESLEKAFEQKVLDEVKKQKTDEQAVADRVRKEVMEELKPQLEALEAMEAIIENIRSLVGDEDVTAADPKLKEQAETAVREKQLAEAKVKELTDQIAALTTRHASELAESQKRHDEAIAAADNKYAVRVAIEEQTVGKKFRLALMERLHSVCAKADDVAAKMADAEAHVAKLLTESVAATATTTTTATGKGEVKDDDTVAPKKEPLTEQQKRMRVLAGLNG